MLRPIQFAFLLAALLFAAHVADAAELRVPTDAIAGAEVSIPTSGSGDATYYLFGPDTAIKRSVKLGEDIHLIGNDIQFSGRYTAVLAGSSNDSGVFFVTPAKPADIAFLARPSRVPASTRQVISGTAFVFDGNHNLVTQPTTVNFNLGVSQGRPETRTATTKDGVAYVILNWTAGAAQFTASLNDDSVRRVVQVTASDPCNLRMRAQPAKNMAFSSRLTRFVTVQVILSPTGRL